MMRRPPRSTQSRSSAASDVYKRQFQARSSSQIGASDTTDDDSIRLFAESGSDVLDAGHDTVRSIDRQVEPSGVFGAGTLPVDEELELQRRLSHSSVDFFGNDVIKSPCVIHSYQSAHSDTSICLKHCRSLRQRCNNTGLTVSVSLVSVSSVFSSKMAVGTCRQPLSKAWLEGGCLLYTSDAADDLLCVD